MTEKDLKQAKPLSILASEVPVETIVRYYLTVEFSKMFKDLEPTVIDKMIGSIKTEEIWELCEAISFTYKINGVFHKLSQTNYVWHEEIWDAAEIVMTGMDFPTNKILLSNEINGDFVKFTNHLREYFINHSETDDPDKLMQHKPKNREVFYNKLLMTYRDGKPHILDGSHRLLELFFSGTTKITCYVGYPISETIPSKTMVGKSTMLYLSYVYKKSDPDGKLAVLSVIKTIIANSTDGRDAFKKYWVDNQYNPEIKEAGIKLLRELDSFGSYC